MEGLNRAFLKLHYMREHPVFILWSTVYFVSFGKIQNEGQSAGNHMNNLGSSETTREAITLDYKKIFEGWLIGFAEGDGGFSIDKRGYLVFKVTQSSVDAQVLFYIKKELGFGSVTVQSKLNKTHQYRVRDKDNLLKIINIFNGKHIVTVRYVISQKDDVEFSKLLANLIDGYVTHIKSYDGYNTVVNFGKLNKILNYLHNYPLKTKKHVSYLRWLKVYHLVKDKKHLTESGIEIIKDKIKFINK
ncbi:hypothetical protein COCVIDRAFT_43288 [Bipolaris victoriae FI3]|uniref:Homing endonuclease LAGLIDADG domain-containing protein n=2 Tax=Bipolaris TaxID=33194 RepID=W6XK54_COCC2|nr:uncharacterized protein COCCADRAFT_41714 [Bipolaris zeicola 26-R-13]XP_014549979.1 hypothetical protein COCVIDRAFT_43288 [Bipolaris victoriae FI3]EUC27597.1 hypothetical protein COCCADRAFT_41714 [Bipolaris zeicola 26-R-13]